MNITLTNLHWITQVLKLQRDWIAEGMKEGEALIQVNKGKQSPPQKKFYPNFSLYHVCVFRWKPRELLLCLHGGVVPP